MRDLLQFMIEPKQNNEFAWNVNKHLWPQLLFLVDQYGNMLQFNYIGLLENINITLPMLFERYEKIPIDVVRQYLNKNISENSRSRKYDKVYSKYNHYIMKQDLNQTDIELIRELYWLDYQCLFSFS